MTNVIYKAVPSMSQRCSKSNVGCIEYKGNNGNNIRNVLVEDFERGTFNPWSFSNGLSAYPSTESLQYGGSSMAIYTGGGATQFTLSYNLTENGASIIPGREYTLSFWVKKFSNSSLPNVGVNPPAEEVDEQAMNIKNLIFNKVRAQENSNLTFTSPVIDNAEWEFRQLNIVVAPTTIVEGNDVFLIINIPIINTDAVQDGIFIDNIVLKEFQNNFYKIRDSWNTPRVCVDSDNNGSIDNKYLGCREYKDRNKSSNYLYQFSDICNPENVGCRAVIDTKNSKMPFKQIFNAYCNNVGNQNNPECTKDKYYYLNNREEPISGNITDSTIMIPEDTIEYIIEDNKYKCVDSEKGCQSLAILDNNGKPSDVFKINNPDNYMPDDYFGGQNQILCLSNYNNCVAMKKSDGGYLFKIHPREKLCEYRKEDVGSGLPAGFYKKDTSESCDGLLYNKNYDELINNIENTLIDNSPFPAFNNSYASICPATQNSCTAFIDPEDNLNQIPEMIDLSTRWGLYNLSADGNIASSDGNITNISSGIEFDAGSGELVRNNYEFSVEQKQTYKLGGFVKFDASSENQNRFISTYLICKKNKDSNEYYYSSGENKLPYALPDLNSNYFVKENAGNTDKYIYIYGLYTIEPGANFCNVAFYYGGDGGNISITDMSFEKLQGYYTYIDNQNIDRTSCQKPNKENGCVLFHQITDPTLRWNSEKSYYNSSLVNGDSYSVGDSNVLLKVIKDRTCGEWVTCGSSIKTIDEKTGQEKNSCISLVGCNSLSSDNAQCDNYIIRGDKAKPLTFDDYQREMGNNLSWSDMDYSGYSVPGLYPIDSLSAFQINTTTKNYELGKTIMKKNPDGKSYVYKFGLGVDPVESYYDSNKYLDTKYKSCRLYPEKDSPFVWTPTIVSGSTTTQVSGDYYYSIPTSLNQRFQNAKICQPKIDNNTGSIDWSLGLNNDCDCSYTKATYNSENSLYFAYGYEKIPEKIYDEYDEGATLKKKSQTDFIGWRGFCLEQDDSFLTTPLNLINGGNRYQTRCLSWYPVDTVSGEFDSYSASMESKIPVPSNSSVCLVSDDYIVPEDRFYCAYWSSSETEEEAGLFMDNETSSEARCNVIAFIPGGTKMKVNNHTDSLILKLFDSEKAYWLNQNKYLSESITSSNLSYDIVYGSDWENWYLQNVYNSAYHCGIYDDDSNGPEGGSVDNKVVTNLEKEKKFLDSDFNNFYSENRSGNEDLSLIQNFRNVFTNVKFYYYDEGVQPNGSTYTGGGTAGYGVYDWMRPDPPNSERIYRTDQNNDDENNIYLPIGGSVLGFEDHDDRNECGYQSVEGDAYRKGCLQAKDLLGGNVLNDTIPDAHEVFTGCRSCDGAFANYSCGFSVWNPKRFNYYVHYNFDNGNSYFDPWFVVISNEVDEYNTTTTPLLINTSCGSNCMQGCNIIGLLDGMGENDAVIHSDNYYINTISPMIRVASSTDISDICINSHPGGTCSIIKTGIMDDHYGENRVIRVTEVSSTDDFDSVSQTTPFASNKNEYLQNPIAIPTNSSGGYQSPYFGYYSDSNFKSAKDSLRNVFIKIPEVKTWTWNIDENGEYNGGSWQSTSQNTWDLTVYNDSTQNTYINDPSSAPVVKQVLGNGEGNTGITVNNNNSTNIYAVKNLKADISFYAYAQWGRSPIKEIKFDWYGDGLNTLTLTGPFKNKRANCIRKCAYTYNSILDWNSGSYCDSDSDCIGDQKCFSYGWGNDPRSCSEDKFNYSFVYVCTPDSDQWYESCDVAGGEPCCIFQPKVIVTDSWGNSSQSTIPGGKSIIITTNKGMTNIASQQENTGGNNEANY
ncbi:MAG TPA: hypothetical protein PKL13_02190 [bacterium]|nr:hypothetical protein [bacterium]